MPVSGVSIKRFMEGAFGLGISSPTFIHPVHCIVLTQRVPGVSYWPDTGEMDEISVKK